MRIVRYKTNGDEPQYGWLLDEKVGEIQGSMFGEYRRREAKTPLADVKLVASCEPSKILCVGRNYVELVKELCNEVPQVHLIFMKQASSIISNGDSIFLPPQYTQVDD